MRQAIDSDSGEQAKMGECEVCNNRGYLDGRIDTIVEQATVGYDERRWESVEGNLEIAVNKNGAAPKAEFVFLNLDEQGLARMRGKSGSKCDADR